MSILKRQNKLFKKWSEERSDFCRDGIVCEKLYVQSNPKILIVLKEPNGNNEKEDIIQWLTHFNDPGADITWDNVARWACGIRRITNNEGIPDWKEMERSGDVNSEEFNEFKKFKIKNIKSICVMNLKKVPGGGTANNKTLKQVAMGDKDMLKDQYKIYDPDLTICGGTGKLFCKSMGHEIKDGIEWCQTKRGVWWYEREVGKYVVSYKHPAARENHSRLFYDLMNAINEIYNPVK